MMLVPAICPECESEQEVDRKEDYLRCKYCGKAFVTKTAINKYMKEYDIANNDIVKAANTYTEYHSLLDRVTNTSNIFLYTEAIIEYQKKYGRFLSDNEKKENQIIIDFMNNYSTKIHLSVEGLETSLSDLITEIENDLALWKKGFNCYDKLIEYLNLSGKIECDKNLINEAKACYEKVEKNKWFFEVIIKDADEKDRLKRRLREIDIEKEFFERKKERESRKESYWIIGVAIFVIWFIIGFFV